MGGDICYRDRCDNAAYDECCKCGSPTCKVHGREYRDQFICVDCMDEFEEQMSEDEGNEY